MAGGDHRSHGLSQQRNNQKNISGHERGERMLWPKVQMLPNKFEIFLQSLREGGQTHSVQNLNISYVFANCQWYYVMTQ